MNLTQSLAIMGLFARTSLRRTLNMHVQSTSRLRKVFSRKTEDAATARDASVHRKEKSGAGSKTLAILGAAFLVMIGMFATMRTLESLLHTIRLQDARSQPVLLIDSEHLAQLQEAVALPESAEREEKIDAVLGALIDKMDAPAQSAELQKLASERLKQDGIAGFATPAVNSAWSGTLALLSPEAREHALRAGAMLLLVLNLAALGCGLTMGISMNRDANQASSLEWLLQFPVSRPVIFAARLAENVVDAPLAIILMSAATCLLTHSGWNFWPALLLASLMAASALVTSAAIKLAADIVLMQKCSVKVQGLVVGLVSSLGGASLLVFIAYGHTPFIAKMLCYVARVLPTWAYMNPFTGGLGLGSKVTSQPGLWIAVSPLVAIASVVASLWLTTRLTATGLASRQDTVRGTTERRSIFAFIDNFVGGLAWKELLQLRRQHNIILGVTIAPLALGLTMLLSSDNPAETLQSYTAAGFCLLIFGGMSYMLFLAATTTLNQELSTLWLLQCQPRSLADSILAKARVWAVIVTIVGVLLTIPVLIVRPDDQGMTLVRLVAMTAFAWLLAESVFGLVTLGATVVQEQSVRLSKTALLLPAIIVADGALAVYRGDAWSLLVQSMVLLLLNAAVRQKLRAEIQWLTEPADAPPKQLYALHGLIAVIGFVFLQQLVTGVLVPAELPLPVLTVIACAFSATAVAAVTALWRHRAGIRILPEMPGRSAWPAVTVGIVASLLWAVVSGATIYHLQGGAIVNPMRDVVVASDSSSQAFTMVITGFLMIVIAPLFEEWIFRGLLYNGLRKSWGVAASTAMTCLLFLAIHPAATSTITIAGLAVATTLAMERTHRLWPSVLIHAGYNALVFTAWHL